MTQEKKAFPTYRIRLIDEPLGAALPFARELMALVARQKLDVPEEPKVTLTFELQPTSRESRAALEAFIKEAETTLFLAMELEQIEATE